MTMMAYARPESHAPIPLPTLVACGDARDIGYALGRHAAAALHDALARPFAPHIERWRGSRRVAELFAAASRYFPDLCLELEGIARGASLPLQDIQLLNCAADLPAADPTADTGCTTLMLPAVGAAHPALIAHHEDASLTAPVPWFMAHIARTDKPAFTCFCYGGRLPGNAFSINAAGLVQTINDVRLLQWETAVPRAFLARAILECRDTAAAVALIEGTPRASGYHHAVGSVNDGRVLSIEAPCSEVVVTEVAAPAAHANHLIHGALRHAKQYVVGGSMHRQSIAQDRLAMARAEPLAAMRGVDAEGHALMQRAAAGNDWHETLATALFEIRSDRDIQWTVFGNDGRELMRGAVAASRFKGPASSIRASSFPN